MKNNILTKALSLQPKTRNYNIKQERYVYKRKSRQYHPRYFAHLTILIRCILHCRNPVRPCAAPPATAGCRFIRRTTALGAPGTLTTRSGKPGLLRKHIIFRTDRIHFRKRIYFFGKRNVFRRHAARFRWNMVFKLFHHYLSF